MPDSFAMAINPRTPTTLYVTPGEGVWKSTDGARTWKATGVEIAKQFVRALAVDPVTPDTVYAGTINEGTYKSMDGGASWTQIATGRMKGAKVYSLHPDPARPGIVWAGVSNELLFTDDGGRRWTSATRGFGYMHFGPIVLDPSGSRALWAGTSRDGVLHTFDGGASWTGPGASFVAADITAVLTDPASPRTIWAATNAGGGTRLRALKSEYKPMPTP